MSFDYINEAFKKLDILEEQMFDTSLKGINELSDFMENDDTTDIVRVIDPDTVESTELQDSYVGKVIINCNVCHSHIFEDKDELVIEEDGSVNVSEQCPYCGESEGFVIVGEIAPFAADEETKEEPEEEVTPSEETIDEEPSDTATEEDTLEESFVGAALASAAGALAGKAVAGALSEEHPDEINRPLRKSRATRIASRKHEEVECADLTEDFKEVSITTEDQHLEMTSDEDGKVTVTTEPIKEESEATEETIVPVSDETQEEIVAAATAASETESDEGEEFDFDFDEVDESGIDELGESYLRRVYENVESFKTTSIFTKDQQMIVEGVITFASGAKKRTGFLFEAKDFNSRGQLRFTGSNKQLAESTDAFSIVGTIDNKKLFVESFKYDYKVDENSVRGIIRRK